MTPEDRKALAEQILTNPLTEILLGELEHEAIERGINAPLADDKTRLVSALDARAVRAFRSKLEQSVQENRPRKGAPA